MKSNKRIKREAKQLFQLCCANGVLDESRVRQVAERVSGAGYRKCPVLLDHFLRLVRMDETQHSAQIESAAALPDDLQAQTRADLMRLYGPGLRVRFSERPELIGGMRIQVGSDVYDGSVRAGLAALNKSF
jgi:F-type H+-transporting ATPase subunit delta